MRPTLQLLKQQPRKPLIRFLGKRTPPKKIDHSPHVHPASPSTSLPNSFASYRQKAQQHGPLGGRQQQDQAPPSSSSASAPPSSTSSSAPSPSTTSTAPAVKSAVGGRAGKNLGSVQPKEGEFFDREELPVRFRRTGLAVGEMEAVESGGASLWG